MQFLWTHSPWTYNWLSGVTPLLSKFCLIPLIRWNILKKHKWASTNHLKGTFKSAVKNWRLTNLTNHFLCCISSRILQLHKGHCYHLAKMTSGVCMLAVIRYLNKQTMWISFCKTYHEFQNKICSYINEINSFNIARIIMQTPVTYNFRIL